MKTQEQFLQDILDLKQMHPSKEIHFCVDSQEVLDEGWTAHQITKVELSSWFCDDERILVDDDVITEYFTDMADPELSELELEVHVNNRFMSEVKMAICVYTHAG